MTSSQQKEHVASLDPYRVRVSLSALKKRPVYGTRYHVKCSCGWSVADVDYISARRRWQGHNGYANTKANT